MAQSPSEFLEKIYNEAMSTIGSKEIITSNLNQNDKDLLDSVLKYSEQAKACLAVIMTSLTYKYFNQSQDIRKHQASIIDGYAGRTYDQKNVTPFLKIKKFPAMQSGSGWLTRSFEQKMPFNKDFTGAISPKELKVVFLDILDNIQKGIDCKEYLDYLIQGLIIQRNKQAIDLAKPTTLSISSILNLLEKHFGSSYKAEGASRLPVLAIYAAYKCLINETKRFENKQLLPLENHTSSDKSSGRIGDIDILDEKNREFEAVEVKYGIPITLQLLQDARSKFQTTPVDRYYILSTAESTKEEWAKIEDEVKSIKNVHGCQVIVNGIMPTLKYYLRLLTNPFEFIENYVNLLEEDTSLKYEHKEKWNKLISEMR